jgi:hypothetical protein
MTHDFTIGAAAVLGTFFGCRMAYGCWPWEWTKTWHTRTVVRNHLGYTDEQWSSVSDLCTPAPV